MGSRSRFWPRRWTQSARWRTEYPLPATRRFRCRPSKRTRPLGPPGFPDPPWSARLLRSSRRRVPAQLHYAQSDWAVPWSQRVGEDGGRPPKVPTGGAGPLRADVRDDQRLALLAMRKPALVDVPGYLDGLSGRQNRVPKRAVGHQFVAAEHQAARFDTFVYDAFDDNPRSGGLDGRRDAWIGCAARWGRRGGRSRGRRPVRTRRCRRRVDRGQHRGGGRRRPCCLLVVIAATSRDRERKNDQQPGLPNSHSGQYYTGFDNVVSTLASSVRR